MPIALPAVTTASLSSTEESLSPLRAAMAKRQSSQSGPQHQALQQQFVQQMQQQMQASAGGAGGPAAGASSGGVPVVGVHVPSRFAPKQEAGGCP